MNQITLPTSNHFNIISETLTRLGIANNKTKTLWQSCHIIHLDNKYYIAHFKELLGELLNTDTKIELSEEDKLRLDGITYLLHEFKLCDLVDEVPVMTTPNFRILSHKKVQEENWELVFKYNIKNRGIK